MTIDFRDQGMGGFDIAPLIAHTETGILTTSWAEYSITTTAPTTGIQFLAPERHFRWAQAIRFT